MFEPASKLFTSKANATWHDADVKHFVQEYLRRATRSEQIYCQNTGIGRIVVRVGSPVLYQEVRLLEYDLQRALEREAHYSLKKLKISL